MPVTHKRNTVQDTVTVRDICIEDVPKIYALGERLFSSHKFTTLYRTWNQNEVAQLFFADAEYCLVAEHHQNIVGFVLGTIIEKPRTGRRYGYILWLGVRPAYQGKGVADILIRRLVRRFRRAGVQMVMADTSIKNYKAIRFFSRHGFNNAQGHVYLSKNLACQ